jgi:hypothetical protein
MLLADRSASLKWSGDFTLPRFRAKLANQYSLHPEVSPGYDEFYRSDLQKTTITRRDLAATLGDCAYALRSSASSPLGGTAGTGTLSRTQLGASNGPFNLTALGGTMTRSSSGAGILDRADSSLGLQSSLGRSSSVPTLGLRRMEALPAAARLAKTAVLEKVRNQDRAPTSPMSPEDRKEKDKEQKIIDESRRLWSAAHGSELHIKGEIDKRNNGEDIQLRSIAVPGMTKALRNGAKLDWKNEEWDGATLLLKAVRTNSQALAEYLLAVGADGTVVDNSGRGVFHWAAMDGNPAMMEFLLHAIGDPQIQAPDNGGDTPLHLAAYHGHLPIIRLLIREKVDVTQRNSLGFDALELAEARRMWHVAHYLNESKYQEEDKTTEDFQVRNLVRPCNVGRANELRVIAALNPKAKPKAAAKKK